MNPVLIAGTHVWAQFPSRDPAPIGATNPSDAADFVPWPRSEFIAQEFCDVPARRASNGGMSETFPATPEQLFSDARWLRRLAGGLAADPSAADDLVQDTWLAALRGGAQRGVASPRAWMRRVLFREAGHQARRNVLRREREQGASRREALPSTIELAERAELQRTLAAAVLALEEPYRSTILWRYYSDLSCEQIAERLGAPASTVRNRLRRGLELLRVALERRGVSQAGFLGFKVGDWGDECIPGMEKAIAMGTSVKITLVAAAVIVAAFMLWDEFQGLDPSAPEAAVLEVAEAPRAAVVNEAGSRTAIQSPAAPAQETTAPVDPVESPTEFASPTSALDAMQDQLRSQIEASLLGHVDPAFYLALAQQLTKLEPGELATEPAPGGGLRYPLKGTPEGMQAEYRISTSENAAGGGRMDSIKLTLDNPFDDEPYVVGGLPRRPAEVMLSLWRNPAGEVQHFGILTNLYPRRLPDFFSSDSMIFSYDVQKPLAVQGDVAGTRDGEPGVIKDTPIVIVGGKWPDLKALNQFNAGMNGLHAKR